MYPNHGQVQITLQIIFSFIHSFSQSVRFLVADRERKGNYEKVKKIWVKASSLGIIIDERYIYIFPLLSTT